MEYEVPQKEHFILRAEVLLPVQEQPQVYWFSLCFYLYNNAKYAHSVWTLMFELSSLLKGC
jgi:hypothetical protein